MAVALSFLVQTPYGGDDLINHNTWPNFYNWPATLNYAWNYSYQWMQVQGRFFPGAFFWTASIFRLIQIRFIYHIFLAGLIYLYFRTTRNILKDLGISFKTQVASILVLLSGFYLETNYSPYNQYSGLIIWSLFLSVCTLRFALKIYSKNRKLFSIFMATTLFFAFSSYELSLLILIPQLLLYVSRRREKIATTHFVGLVAPALLYFSISYYLRSHATGIIPKYSFSLSNFSWAAYITQLKGTFLYNFAQVFTNSSSNHMLGTWIVFIAFALTLVFSRVLHSDATSPLPATFVKKTKSHKAQNETTYPLKAGRHFSIFFVISGLSFISLPPLLFALSKFWSTLPNWNEPYLYTPFQTLGFAVLLVPLIEKGWANIPRTQTFVLIFLVLCEVLSVGFQVQTTQPGDQFTLPRAQCLHLPDSC